MFEDEEVSGLSEPARLLVRAVAALRAQDATALPGPQALAETAVLLREREKFAALTLSRLADVDTRELYALAGSPSASSWVAEQHTSTDRSVVALARKLSRLPAVEAAVLDGRLCLPAAITVGQAVDRCRRHVDRPDGQIDGHHGEDVVRQVVVDGVLDLLAEARGGYDQHDPQLAALTGQLEQIAQAGTSQLSRLQCAFVLLAEQLEPAQLPRALERLVDAVLPLQHADAVEDSHRRRALKLTRNSDGTGWTIAGGTWTWNAASCCTPC